MARYAAAVLGGGSGEHGSVLQAETLASMFAPHYRPDPRLPGVGLAFFRHDIGGHLVVEHDGLVPGFNSQMSLAPHDGVGTLAFPQWGTQRHGVAGAEVADILGHVLGVPGPVIRADVPHHPELWADICGWYWFRGSLRDVQKWFIAGAEVFVGRGQLMIRAFTQCPPVGGSRPAPCPPLPARSCGGVRTPGSRRPHRRGDQVRWGRDAERGSGEPLLMIHGFFGGCDEALLSLRGLAADRRAIAPSRFGYLGSDMPAGATVAGQADAFAALLDGLGIARLDVAAISSGATSALQFALRHPDRVKHLAVICGNLPGSASAGIARYIRLPEPGTAEVAVAVADRWRGRGIASLLLQRIAARARAEGIDCFTAPCLSSNTAILRLLRRLGPMTTTAPTAGVVDVRIDLRRASTATR